MGHFQSRQTTKSWSPHLDRSLSHKTHSRRLSEGLETKPGNCLPGLRVSATLLRPVKGPVCSWALPLDIPGLGLEAWIVGGQKSELKPPVAETGMWGWWRGLSRPLAQAVRLRWGQNEVSGTLLLPVCGASRLPQAWAANRTLSSLMRKYALVPRQMPLICLICAQSTRCLANQRSAERLSPQCSAWPSPLQVPFPNEAVARTRRTRDHGRARSACAMLSVFWPLQCF